MRHTHIHEGVEPISHSHEHPETEASCHATRMHLHADGIRHSHPHADKCIHANALPKHRKLKDL